MFIKQLVGQALEQLDLSCEAAGIVQIYSDQTTGRQLAIRSQRQSDILNRQAQHKRKHPLDRLQGMAAHPIQCSFKIVTVISQNDKAQNFQVHLRQPQTLCKPDQIGLQGPIGRNPDDRSRNLVMQLRYTLERQLVVVFALTLFLANPAQSDCHEDLVIPDGLRVQHVFVGTHGNHDPQDPIPNDVTIGIVGQPQGWADNFGFKIKIENIFAAATFHNSFS